MTPTPPVKRDEPRVRQAWQSILLILFVATVNLALFLSVDWYVRAFQLVNTFFPALALFLCFTLSIGVILILAVGEQVTTSDKAWLKYGVTPVLVIVSALASFFLASGPLASSLISGHDPTTSWNVKLAKIAVKCSGDVDRVGVPQAADLLVVVTSTDETYIESAKTFMQNSDRVAEYNRRERKLSFELINRDQGNPFYAALERYLAGRRNDAPMLRREMSDDSKWFAYRISLEAAERDTHVPVPTHYNKQQRTRLFVVERKAQYAGSARPALATLQSSARPSPTQIELAPLLEIGINPLTPVQKPESHMTKYDVNLYAGQACWQSEAPT